MIGKKKKKTGAGGAIKGIDSEFVWVVKGGMPKPGRRVG